MDRLPYVDPYVPGMPPLFGGTRRDADADARSQLTAFVREQHRMAAVFSKQARIIERILERVDRGK